MRAVQRETNRYRFIACDDLLDDMLEVGKPSIESPGKRLVAGEIHRRVAAENSAVLRRAQLGGRAAPQPVLLGEEVRAQRLVLGDRRCADSGHDLLLDA